MSTPWHGEATIYGPPGTKGSVRAFTPKGAKFPIVTNDNPRAKSWQQELAYEMRATRPDQLPRGPIRVRFTVYLARPKSHYGSGRNASMLKPSAPAVPTVKPDLDKVERCLLDAGTGVWYVDDAQIVEVEKRKRWAPDGHPRTVVEAWEWTGEGE